MNSLMGPTWEPNYYLVIVSRFQTTDFQTLEMAFQLDPKPHRLKGGG